MTKVFALLSAKPGMDFNAFIDRYENGHVPLIERLVPLYSSYKRNFVVPEGAVALGHVGAAAPRPAFDVLTIMSYEGEALKELSKKLAQPGIGDAIAADEEEFFDRSKMQMFSVEEHRTPAERLQPRPAGHTGAPAIKQIALLKKKPGMTREAFIAYYENNHSELAMKILLRNGKPIFAGYNRNYPIPSGRFEMPHLAKAPPPFDYDCVSEFWFWTQDDYDFFVDLCGERGIGAALELDETQLFDRGAITMFKADERVTR